MKWKKPLWKLYQHKNCRVMIDLYQLVILMLNTSHTTDLVPIHQCNQPFALLHVYALSKSLHSVPD